MAPDILVATIIKDYMTLPQERIWLYNQRVDAPKDNGLYVIVSLRGQNIVGASSKIDSEDKETSGVVVSASVDVDVVSKSRAAVERVNEVVIALGSTAAQNLMEQEGARVFRAGNILDLSAIEAAASLHRYRVSVSVHYTQAVKRAVEPFEHFPQEVESE